jgi:hypothetical protein
MVAMRQPEPPTVTLRRHLPRPQIWRLLCWHVQAGKLRHVLAACALPTLAPASVYAQPTLVPVVIYPAGGYGCEYIPPPPPPQLALQLPPHSTIIPTPYYCDRLNPASTIVGCDKTISEEEKNLAHMQRDLAQHAPNARSPAFAKTMQSCPRQIAWDRATRLYVMAHPRQFHRSP